MRQLNFGNFPLQFITNGKDGQECVCQAQKVLEGGCRWVQLRMKDAQDGEIEETAKEIKLHTDNYGATFIIDDKVDICKRPRLLHSHTRHEPRRRPQGAG